MNDTVGEVKTANNRTSENSKISIKSYTGFMDMKILGDELDVLISMCNKFQNFLGSINMLTFS